jgi:hypothetical protein
MASDPKTKSQASAKTADARRERLAAELRSNLRKRKARTRSIDGQQKQAQDGDDVHE